MTRRSGMAATLTAARSVLDALGRLPPSRALKRRELVVATDIPESRLRRLLPAMIAAGWPVASAPDPTTSGPPNARPRVYWLQRSPGERRNRRGE